MSFDTFEKPKPELGAREAPAMAEIKPIDYLWLLDDRPESDKKKFVESLSPRRRAYYDRLRASGMADMVVAVEEMETYEREQLHAWAKEAILRDPHHRATPGLRQIKQAIEERHTLVDDARYVREPGD